MKQNYTFSGSEQKLLEIEDIYDGERKDATVKIDSLTSIVKMFEASEAPQKPEGTKKIKTMLFH